MAAFNDVFAGGRRVLVTGHTGFKGAWLCEWLLGLGADVTGLALAPNTDPALFDLLGLRRRMSHTEGDIRAGDVVTRAFAQAQPEVVLHLAAQPLVRVGYREPKATWDTNVSGTVNVLEAVRATPSVRACVVVTSDKCYENLEVPRGYRESDALGGGDPYSSSKAACELVVASWRRSFFSEHSACRLASARAGNVIGGGDWAPDRLVADCAAAMRAGRPLRLRSQRATRPWQHVLEPLSGYLDLAGRLLGTDGPAWGEAWNFGPTDASVTTVEALARKLVSAWGRGVIEVDGSGGHPHEAGILQLDSAKAQARLGWRGAWDLDTAVMRTVEWYRAHAQGDSDLGNLTRVQIATYVSDAREAGLPWTQRGAP